MIAGLRLLPWILAFRQEYEAPELYDCEACMGTGNRQALRTRAGRRAMRCGFVSPALRTGPGERPNVPFRFPVVDAAGHEVVSQCPGWLIRLPDVYESQVAYYWAEKGQLRDRYPDVDDLTHVMDHIQVLSAEQSAVDTWRMKPKDKR